MAKQLFNVWFHGITLGVKNQYNSQYSHIQSVGMVVFSISYFSIWGCSWNLVDATKEERVIWRGLSNSILMISDSYI